LRHFLRRIFGPDFFLVHIHSELGLYLRRVQESFDNHLIAAEIIVDTKFTIFVIRLRNFLCHCDTVLFHLALRQQGSRVRFFGRGSNSFDLLFGDLAIIPAHILHIRNGQYVHQGIPEFLNAT